MDDDVMAALAAVLEALAQIEAEWPDKPCSGRLSKQAHCR
jgi:hypothetical protein